MMGRHAAILVVFAVATGFSKSDTVLAGAEVDTDGPAVTFHATVAGEVQAQTAEA